MSAPLTLLVDADACPVKDEVVKVALRHGLAVFMVSGQGLRPYRLPKIECVVAGDKFDAADDWIVARAQPRDVVITADILLAQRAVEMGAQVLSPTGKEFTKESIGTAVAMRELNQYLREAGEIAGHNAPFTPKDRANFSQALERVVRGD